MGFGFRLMTKEEVCLFESGLPNGFVDAHWNGELKEKKTKIKTNLVIRKIIKNKWLSIVCVYNSFCVQG